jgi:hypothetical protein
MSRGDSMSHQRSRHHPLERLEFTSRIRKRAQYEAFEFSLIPEGLLVRNASYAEPENHEYRVTVENGVPSNCTCPADTRFKGACKHRVAAAIRRPVLTVVTQVQTVTDGGHPPSPTRYGHADSMIGSDKQSSSSEPTETSACDTCESLDSLPCWECFRSQSRADALLDDRERST